MVDKSTLITAARSKLGWTGVALCLAACAKPEPPYAPTIPLSQLEATYGPLISAGNEPTPEQHGTGDRIGLFRDRTGTIWGLPLTIDAQGAVLGCAPFTAQDAPVTDTLPSDTTDVVGAMNAPTGWRGGTGKLELLLRNARGEVRWQAVMGRRVETGPVCWPHRVPALQQLLHYFRLARAAHGP